jgi:hypothetical protein
VLISCPVLQLVFATSISSMLHNNPKKENTVLSHILQMRKQKKAGHRSAAECVLCVPKALV